MLTSDFQRIHMSGINPFDPCDVSNVGKFSPRENNHPSMRSGTLHGMYDPSTTGLQLPSQILKGPSGVSIDSEKLGSQNIHDGVNKRSTGGDNDASSKRQRLEEDTRSLQQGQLLQHYQQQHQLQQQQQLEHHQMMQQQQMQQQQQSDIPMDNFLGRNWNQTISMDQANMNSMLRAMFPSGQNQTGNNVPQSSLFLDDNSLRRAELSAHLLREQASRNQSVSNAALLASIGCTPLDSIFGQGQSWPPMQQQASLPHSASQQAQQLANLRSFTEIDPFLQTNRSVNSPRALSQMLNNPPAIAERNQDLALLLRQMQSNGSPAGLPAINTSMVLPNQGIHEDSVGMFNQQSTVLELPPCDEGLIESYTKRPSFHLGIDEDPNWLSEFHCFVRSELVEVFRASNEDVKARNNSIAFHQVGIRCRFCAHMTPSARAGRSSAFPSSLRQIYQSFTMMLRDHFGNCDAMPSSSQDKFMLLKDKPAQGATDSKRYWIYSAMKIGMTDSSEGIMINEQSRAVGARSPSFGTNPGQRWEDDACRSVPLVLPSDRPLVSEFLFVLMSQVQPIRLTEAECIGNRRSLRVGLPGFGCKYCCENRRLGLCRMFPARRRTLPSKVNDVYDHLRRCTVCPDSVKKHLERTKHQMNTGFHADQGGDREFFDRVWSRLGHESQAA